MTGTATKPLFLTLAQAAKVAGVSADTLSRAIHADGNPLRAKRTARIGGKFLIRVSDLEAWFDGLEDA